jgi:hypothetical protein
VRRFLVVSTSVVSTHESTRCDREVRSVVVVVRNKLGEEPVQVALVEDDHVIEQISPHLCLTKIRSVSHGAKRPKTTT